MGCYIRGLYCTFERYTNQTLSKHDDAEFFRRKKWPETAVNSLREEKVREMTGKQGIHVCFVRKISLVLELSYWLSAVFWLEFFVLR